MLTIVILMLKQIVRMEKSRVLLCVLCCCLMGLISCRENLTSEEQAKHTMKEALEALNRNDFDAYLQRVDDGVSMDSAQKAVMRDVLRQHVECRRKERPAVVSIDMIDIQMDEDTVCTVYYQYTFADSTKEVGAQKMVRKNEQWRIRLRD